MYNGYLSWVNKYVERDDATAVHVRAVLFSPDTRETFTDSQTPPPTLARFSSPARTMCSAGGTYISVFASHSRRVTLFVMINRRQ